MKILLGMMICFLLACLIAMKGLSQSVGIGTNNPSPNAILDVRSSASPQGFLMPRLAGADTSSFGALTSTDKGLIFYDTTTTVFRYWNGTVWEMLAAPIAETDPQVGALATNFVSKWNGSQLVGGLLYDNGTNVGIGTTFPTSKLQIFQNLVTTVPLLRLQQQNTGGDAALLFTVTSGNEYALGVDASDDHKFKISGNNTLGTNDRLTIDSLGSVGIGTTDPASKLTVDNGNIAAGGMSLMSYSGPPANTNSTTFVNLGGNTQMIVFVPPGTTLLTLKVKCSMANNCVNGEIRFGLGSFSSPNAFVAGTASSWYTVTFSNPPTGEQLFRLEGHILSPCIGANIRMDGAFNLLTGPY